MANKKMTTCKTCGVDIAMSAKVCPNCGAKVKKPIYKKLWFWLIIIILVVIVASGPSSSKREISSMELPEVQNGNQAVETQEMSEQNASSVDSQVFIIADDDYITASFEKIYDASNLGIDGVFYIDINVKNKTDKEIWIYLDKASVNDEMVPLVMSGVPLYVEPNKSGRNAFIISFESLSIDKVEDVRNIEFDLVIEDEETLDEIERIENVSLDF